MYKLLPLILYIIYSIKSHSIAPPELSRTEKAVGGGT